MVKSDIALETPIAVRSVPKVRVWLLWVVIAAVSVAVAVGLRGQVSEVSQAEVGLMHDYALRHMGELIPGQRSAALDPMRLDYALRHIPEPPAATLSGSEMLRWDYALRHIPGSSNPRTPSDSFFRSEDYGVRHLGD